MRLIHVFLTDAFCILTDGRRNWVCFSLYLLSNGYLNRYIHPDGPNSSLPRIRRLLYVLLSDLPIRAACRLLGSSARSKGSTDFFGVKPSQVDCPHGSRMGGGKSRWKRDRGVKCHHCNLLTCDSNPESAESATTPWSFDVWSLRLNFALYSDRVPLPPPKLTTCKFQQLKEMALGINRQGQLMWPWELAGLLWLSSSCPAQSLCPLYQTSVKTVAISRDRGKRHWRASGPEKRVLCVFSWNWVLRVHRQWWLSIPQRWGNQSKCESHGGCCLHQ